MDITATMKESRAVLEQSQLKNGAIVSAHIDNQTHPELLQYCNTVSIRDASFACIAADLLAMDQYQEKFFTWCMHLQTIPQTRYDSSGKIHTIGNQPGDAGLLLYAIWHHFRSHPARADPYKPLIKKLADSLCKHFDKSFSVPTKDFWGEFTAFPYFEESFLTTLAACSRGLVSAHTFIPDIAYLKTAARMKEQLDKANILHRSTGNICDEQLDASLLCIAYPFFIYAWQDVKIRHLIKEIRQKLTTKQGVLRYEQDRYDGLLIQKLPLNKGAGTWPAMTALLVIALAKTGQRKQAMYFYKQLLKPELPEQFLPHGKLTIRRHILSHAFFIMATKELGYFIFD